MSLPDLSEVDVVIYHAPCSDGLAAAAVLQRYKPGVELRTWNNEQANEPNYLLEFFEGFDRTAEEVVLFVDCAPANMEQYNYCLSRTKKLIILDHHHTNMQKFAKLENCYFDMKESGCSLAWKACFPDVPLPFVLQLIKKRDTWTDMDVSVEAFSASFQDPFVTAQTIESVLELIDNPFRVLRKISEGETLLIRKKGQVQAAVKEAEQKTLMGVKLAVVKIAEFGLISDVGAELSKTFGAAAMCLDMPEGKLKISLRSEKNSGVDVSALAEKFGGGGHKNAASFVTDKNMDELFDQ